MRSHPKYSKVLGMPEKLFCTYTSINTAIIPDTTITNSHSVSPYIDNGAGVWMLYGGSLVHGICYDFFFVTGQIYVDEKAPPDLRAAAQGLIAFVTLGVGMFIGSWLSGLIVDLYVEGEGHAWQDIWIVPAVWASAVLVLFAVAFKETTSSPATRA